MKTPRERVITALQHKEPDRVPVDLGGHESSGIHCLALKRLLRYLGLDEEVRICDPIQLLGEVPEPLLKKFNVDVINIGRTISPTGLTENDVKFKEYISIYSLEKMAGSICGHGSPLIPRRGRPS